MKVVNVKKNLVMTLIVLVSLGLNACSLFHHSKQTTLVKPEVQEDGRFAFRDIGSDNILKFEICGENSKNRNTHNYRNDCPSALSDRELVATDTYLTTVKLLEKPIGSVECCFEMSINIPGVPPFKACFIDTERDHCIAGEQQ